MFWCSIRRTSVNISSFSRISSIWLHDVCKFSTVEWFFWHQNPNWPQNFSDIRLTSGPRIPVKNPAKNLFLKNFIEPKVVPWNYRGLEGFKPFESQKYGATIVEKASQRFFGIYLMRYNSINKNQWIIIDCNWTWSRPDLTKSFIVG